MGTWWPTRFPHWWASGAAHRLTTNQTGPWLSLSRDQRAYGHLSANAQYTCTNVKGLEVNCFNWLSAVKGQGRYLNVKWAGFFIFEWRVVLCF